jgi:hypothetical protein
MLLVVTLVLLPMRHPALSQSEALFSDTNAYNPVPSPDGSLVAFVRTGWGRMKPAFDLGRADLVSEIEFASTTGKPLKRPEVDAFLSEWLANSSAVVSYRDWRFALVGKHGAEESGTIPQRNPQQAERAAYLPYLKSFVWLERVSDETVLQSPHGVVAALGAGLPTSALVVPSPNGRYLAIASTSSCCEVAASLWVFDTQKRTLATLGPLTIHPDTNWDWLKPSWNPWFKDSARLVFFSGNILYVVTPDGSHKETVLESVDSGLPAPSPDGKWIAYVKYVPRPRKRRPDLRFWGSATLWVVETAGGVSRQVTAPTEDPTYDLRWLNPSTLIFDRLTEDPFYSHARIWIAHL